MQQQESGNKKVEENATQKQKQMRQEIFWNEITITLMHQLRPSLI